MAKKGWIIAAILAALMVVGVGGGVILAHGSGGKGDGGFSKVVPDGASMTERVATTLGLEESVVADAFESVKEDWDWDTDFVAEAATILGVETETLESAISQAKRAMENEMVRAGVDAMVEAELITQAEADEYVQWFEARPSFLDNLERGRKFGRGDGFGGWKHHRGKGGKSWHKSWDESWDKDWYDKDWGDKDSDADTSTE